MYISITGIKVKSFFGMLKFMRYTLPSFTAARKANGNLFCESQKINKYHHTLTAWKNKSKMKDYLRGKRHALAMKNFRFIDRNRKFFSKNPRLSMMVHIFDKMKNDRKKLILSEADRFIKRNTI